MAKITFIGAGSTIFAKNVLGDCLLTKALQNSEIALYDIDEERLMESKLMLDNINKNMNLVRFFIEFFPSNSFKSNLGRLFCSLAISASIALIWLCGCCFFIFFFDK